MKQKKQLPWRDMMFGFRYNKRKGCLEGVEDRGVYYNDIT